MNRNTKIIFLTAAVFSFGVGVYDYILPFYLDDLGISFQDMGFIFGFGALLILPVNVYSGYLSDKFGRKGVIFGCLISCIGANAATPLIKNIYAQFVSKSFREVGFRILSTMNYVVIYENLANVTEKFKFYIARLDGMSLVLQALGILSGGIFLKWFNMREVFFLNGILISFLTVNFLMFFREKSFRKEKKDSGLSLRKIITFDIPKGLKIIAISSCIFRMGITISHCFILQLFFKEKFGLPLITISAILFLHRFSLGFPMFLFGRLIKRNYKFVYIVTVIVEGIIIAVPMVFPVKYYIFAIVIWLTHDAVGAAIWFPLRQTLIQRFARPQSRGSDVSIVLAVQEIGAIFGPILAGFSANMTFTTRWFSITRFDALSAPFVLSGLIIIVSAFVLFKLPCSNEPENQQDYNS